MGSIDRHSYLLSFVSIVLWSCSSSRLCAWRPSWVPSSLPCARLSLSQFYQPARHQFQHAQLPTNALALVPLHLAALQLQLLTLGHTEGHTWTHLDTRRRWSSLAISSTWTRTASFRKRKGHGKGASSLQASGVRGSRQAQPRT